ncbi:MAG: DUF1501 domain-containing protein, partial [Myxococcota bacterium]
MKRHTPKRPAQMSRRGFLTGLAATAAAAAVGVPRITLSEAPSGGTKFIFVYALGGWDPLAAFTPKFDAPLLQIERNAYPVTIGNFNLVGHEGRENLELFFHNHKNNTVLINGVSTRSVAHAVCERVSMTGSSSGSESDWPTLIASQGGQNKAMPALVLSGPTFPGDLEMLVARAGSEQGQLDILASTQGLMDEGITMPIEGITNTEVGGVIDSFVQRRIEMVARKTEDTLRQKRYDDMSTSLQRAAILKRRLNPGELPIEEFYGNVESEATYDFARAVKTLSDGLSRTVMLTDKQPWDTHSDNRGQTPFFNNLFGHLDGLTRHLKATPGEHGGSLYDETVIAVLSEMGRTPRFNEGADTYEEITHQEFQGGRDHWPYTSAVLTGGPIKGNRTFGGFTDNFTGIGVDPISGELDMNSVGISSAQLGATLLAIADIDPERLIP